MRILDGKTAAAAALLFALLSSGCGVTAQSLEEASSSYKQRKDYPSLVLLHRHLTKGMPRPTVERLLGPADYSPVDGQDYYLSDRNAAKGRGVTGLVAEYRDRAGKITNALQDFWLGEIGE